MKIRTFRWILAGGLFGLVVGSYVALGTYLDEMEGKARADAGRTPALNTGPPQLGLPPPPPVSGSSESDSEKTARAVAEIVRPYIKNSEIDRAIAIVEAISDGGKEKEGAELRDLCLQSIVQEMIVPAGDRDFDEDVPEAESDQEKARKHALETFKQVDKDRNGTLSRQEFADEISADKQDKFDELDADGDGKISREEILDSFGLAETPPEKDMGAKPPPTAEKPNDYKKALEVAERIRSPLVKAQLLSAIGAAQMDEPDPKVKSGAAATLARGFEAVKAYQAAAKKTRAADRTPLVRSAFYVSGSCIIGALALGILARLLNMFADSLKGRLGEDLDRNAARAPGA